MYESPLEVMVKQVANQAARQLDDAIEGELQLALEEIAVNVNREELLRALQYDRDQYAKGYEDGKKELAARLKEKIDEIVEELEGV